MGRAQTVTATLALPDEIREALREGGALAVNLSGGKDSQAMATALMRLREAEGWTGPVIAIHADLGRIEWTQTPAHVRRTADEMGVELVIVRRRDGVGEWDMVDRWKQRGETLRAAGKRGRPWSDAGNRFCTAEMKRDPIDRYLRRYGLVVSAQGLRADESHARAKRPVAEPRARITTGDREAWTWNPILRWSWADVLGELGSSVAELEERRAAWRRGEHGPAMAGWRAHPVYVMGNQRLSCAFCVLACQGDLRNAADHNPELLDELIAIEQDYGFTFQPRRSLASLRDRPPGLFDDREGERP